MSRCACGDRDVGEFGESGVWMHYAAVHTPTKCEVEDWRTWRWRICARLSAWFDSLSGPGRTEPRVKVTTRTPEEP
jgi:hypothetical protein